MKKNLLLFVALITVFFMPLRAQETTAKESVPVARSFLDIQKRNLTIRSAEAFSPDGELLAWVVDLEPKGFVLVSPTRKIRPVIAYSYESPWLIGGKRGEAYLTLMKSYFKSILEGTQQTESYRQTCRSEWEMYLSGALSGVRFEQWPPEGTTPTGGWLFTNWSQGSPYNSMCPVDPNTNVRSYTGCPATAMAQILNCIITINNTLLDDGDDYYHSFGSGNQYWIDDDWQQHGFPYFDSLNVYLQSLEENYASNKTPTEEEIAALNFACGVAMKQVYSSSVSGTYGIQQALTGYHRFGFEEARLVYDSDTNLTADLAQNIKDGNPAHLGLVNPQYTVGHNVVVDGYNTDNFFHLNFGWSGSSNGWYTMPPMSAPYNLTVIEGVVLDIFGNNPHVSITEIAKPGNSVTVSFDQQSHLIKVTNNSPGILRPGISIFDGTGRLLKQTNIFLGCKGETVEIPRPSLSGSFFMVKVFYPSGKTAETYKFINICR